MPNCIGDRKRLRSICCAPLKVLDEVRPYLIADGGNVRVMGVDVDRRVVSRLSGLVSSSLPGLTCFVLEFPFLKPRCHHYVICCCRSGFHTNRTFTYFPLQVKLALQGACGSCPSSTTTMKMGIERVLNENFLNMGGVRGSGVRVGLLLPRSCASHPSYSSTNGELCGTWLFSRVRVIDFSCKELCLTCFRLCVPFLAGGTG